jgi:hypothetical protein
VATGVGEGELQAASKPTMNSSTNDLRSILELIFHSFGGFGEQQEYCIVVWVQL